MSAAVSPARTEGFVTMAISHSIAHVLGDSRDHFVKMVTNYILSSRFNFPKQILQWGPGDIFCKSKYHISSHLILSLHEA